jgi:hypothetical protein
MRDELRHRVRVGEQPPDDAQVVLRGGPDTPALIRSHARRVRRLFMLDGASFYGVSVFIALDDVGPGSIQGILIDRLRSYPTVYLTAAGTLRKAGFVLLPTFARPHYTVVMDTLDRADDLMAALGTLRTNPYAGGTKETP